MHKSKNYLMQDLPYKIGAASLAILMGIGGGFINASKIILAGGPNLTLGKALHQMERTKNFEDYYNETYDALKNLKANSFRTALWRLQKKGLVEKENNKYKLTFLGLKYFNKIKEKDDLIKKWDKKWRIVMFDIPEKLRKEREWLRANLYGLEYKPLQKSVFIGKLPISKKLFQEIRLKQLNNFINLITVGEIDKEDVLF